MKIQSIIENINGRYIVQVNVFELTALEEEKSLQFGEPIINIGGRFHAFIRRDPLAQQIEVDYTLPDKHRRIASDFPITQIFDLNDASDADVNAQVFADELKTRIQAAKQYLVVQGAPFIGETITTV